MRRVRSQPSRSTSWLANHPLRRWVTHHIRNWLNVISQSQDLYHANAHEQRVIGESDQVGNGPESRAGPDSVRWAHLVQVGGLTKVGLIMDPDSSATFRLKLPGNPHFRGFVSLMPEIWRQNEGGIEFGLAVRSVANGKTVEAFKRINPSRVVWHRKWNLFVRDISEFAGEEVEIRLSTSVPAGIDPSYARAVWGQPTVYSRRPLSQVAGLALAFLRRHGVLNVAWRMLRAARVTNWQEIFYRFWIARNTLTDQQISDLAREGGALAYRPVMSILTPVYNVEPRWLNRCVESVRAQYYRNWELCLVDDGSSRPDTLAALKEIGRGDSRIKVKFSGVHRGISVTSNEALAMATGEFAALLDHDDELAPEALPEVVRHLNLHPETDMIYTDEDSLKLDGTRCEPFFKPDWSPEYLLSCMYTGHLGVYRKSLMDGLGGFREGYEGAQDYDLVLRLTERTGRIAHVPKVLYHWRKIPQSAAVSVDAKPWAAKASRLAIEDYVKRNGIRASVLEGPSLTYHRIKREIVGNPLVSIIIPTKDNVEVLRTCIASIDRKTRYRNYEILIIDNGSVKEETRRYFASCPHRVVSFPGPFNYSVVNNFGTRHAKGEHLLFMNDDTEVITEEWLGAMLEFSQQKEIGAVGAKLYYPDRRLQHIGVVLGIGGGASHVYSGFQMEHPGYFSSANLVRNYSVVTAACLMMRREVFDEIGGFDESFVVDFNDVDLCLRIRRAGYRIVYTPYAELYHYEAATTGSRVGRVNPKEIESLQRRWGHILFSDPYYNPNLSLSCLDYQIRI